MPRNKEKPAKDELLVLLKARSEVINNLKQHTAKPDPSELLTEIYQTNIRDLEISIADKLQEWLGNNTKTTKSNVTGGSRDT